MELRDSRRLTGPNILWNKAGAVADLEFTPEEWSTPVVADRIVAAWEIEIRRLLDALGWAGESFTNLRFGDGSGGGGVSLAISAPLDALYAATEVNECAVEAAYARVHGAQPSNFDDDVSRLRAVIAEESNPPLIALRNAALERGVAFVPDDDRVSIGMGSGSQTWAARDLPSPERVDWSKIHDVPTAMITGTNGKSTTVRLLAAMADAAGKTPGISSTDWVRVGHQILDEGDWSGPGGARLLLRDNRVNVGILETARGGMMRRGLGLEACDVSAVLNIGADHLNDWGTSTLEELAVSKFTVARVAKRVVINADDGLVVTMAGRLLRSDQEPVWFSLDAENPTVRGHLDAGGTAVVLDDGVLTLRTPQQHERVLPVDEAPLTLGGAARHNIANALAAIGIADGLDLPFDAMRAGLRHFASDPNDNPGRLNRFDLGGVSVLVDFAHNPEGMQATFDMVGALKARRRLVLLGQAGDRDLASVQKMTRAVWEGRPDMVVIKELTEHLRGRERGEMPAIIEAELRAAGAPDEAWCHADDEMAAVRRALEWSQPGDLLLLLVHDVRPQVLDLLDRMDQAGWKPGDPVPD